MSGRSKIKYFPAFLVITILVLFRVGETSWGIREAHKIIVSNRPVSGAKWYHKTKHNCGAIGITSRTVLSHKIPARKAVVARLVAKTRGQLGFSAALLWRGEVLRLACGGAGNLLRLSASALKNQDVSTAVRTPQKISDQGGAAAEFRAHPEQRTDLPCFLVKPPPPASFHSSAGKTFPLMILPFSSAHPAPAPDLPPCRLSS